MSLSPPLKQLAAAVSDFTCTAEPGKIDSSVALSQIKLEPVVKVITKVTRTWAPNVTTISFKLETDESLIVRKAAKYFDQGVGAVIGNELHSRRHKVYFITQDQSQPIEASNNEEIEQLLVDRICTRFA